VGQVFSQKIYDICLTHSNEDVIKTGVYCTNISELTHFKLCIQHKRISYVNV